MLLRPQLGVATWTFGELPLADIARRVAALAYDGVTLRGDLAQLTAVTTRTILADHALQLFALTPMNVDLAHPDTAERQQALDYYTRLLDFAAEAGSPLVSIEPYIGRIRPWATLAAEMTWLVTAVSYLANEAQQRHLRLTFGVRNRYETHLINTGAAAQHLLEMVGRDNVGLTLSAFHMNIEEQDAATTIRQAGSRLLLYHMADSNRQAIGRGHTKLGVHLWALEDAGYTGPMMMECLPPGSDPVTAVANDSARTLLETYLHECRRWF